MDDTDVQQLSEVLHRAMAARTKDVSTTYRYDRIHIDALSIDGRCRIELTIVIKDLP